MALRVIAVTGSRRFNNALLIRNVLNFYWKEMPYLLKVGDSEGADRIAYEHAKNGGRAYKMYAAKWKIYGISAGPRRNREMIDDGTTNLVVAFPDEYSKGTRDCCEYACTIGIPVTFPELEKYRYPGNSTEKPSWSSWAEELI